MKIKKFKKIVYEESDFDINQFMYNLSQNLIKLRKDKDLNQDEFANMINLSRTTIVNIENQRQALTLKSLVIICNTFDIKSEDLLGI